MKAKWPKLRVMYFTKNNDFYLPLSERHFSSVFLAGHELDNVRCEVGAELDVCAPVTAHLVVARRREYRQYLLIDDNRTHSNICCQWRLCIYGLRHCLWLPFRSIISWSPLWGRLVSHDITVRHTIDTKHGKPWPAKKLYGWPRCTWPLKLFHIFGMSCIRKTEVTGIYFKSDFCLSLSLSEFHN